MRAIPNNRKPVAKDPIRKYLKAASVESKLSFLLPARTYNGMERISMPRNNIAMLLKEHINKAPAITNMTSDVLSVWCAPAEKYDNDIQNQKSATTIIN